MFVCGLVFVVVLVSVSVCVCMVYKCVSVHLRVFDCVGSVGLFLQLWLIGLGRPVYLSYSCDLMHFIFMVMIYMCTMMSLLYKSIVLTVSFSFLVSIILKRFRSGL